MGRSGADKGPGGNGSAGSILSIGSSGSILSIGSAGSILSIGSAGSVLSIGSVGSFASVLSVASAMSFGSVLSTASRWSIRAYRSGKPSSAAHHHLHAGNGSGPKGADPGRSGPGSGRHGAFRPPDWLTFIAR